MERKRKRQSHRLNCHNTSHTRRSLFFQAVLNKVRGPTSFAGLRTIEGKKEKTFREAALLLGLLQEDTKFQQCLEEAAAYQLPYAL